MTTESKKRFKKLKPTRIQPDSMYAVDKKKYELRKQGLDVKFKSGGIASGIRRFNRGGKV